jgi:hypothetical protein
MNHEERVRRKEAVVKSAAERHTDERERHSTDKRHQNDESGKVSTALRSDCAPVAQTEVNDTSCPSPHKLTVCALHHLCRDRV